MQPEKYDENGNIVYLPQDRLDEIKDRLANNGYFEGHDDIGWLINIVDTAKEIATYWESISHSTSKSGAFRQMPKHQWMHFNHELIARLFESFD